MIEGTPAGRAVLEAAAEGQVGAPVYLRLAGETAGEVDIVRRAAGAMHFASLALGAPVAVYVAAVSGPGGPPVYLALTVRHAAGAVALLGIGDARTRDDGSARDASEAETPGGAIGPGQTAPPSLLLLGDRGAVERYPGPAGTAPAVGGRDPRADQNVDRFAAAIRRSLASGRQEPIAPEGGPPESGPTR